MKVEEEKVKPLTIEEVADTVALLSAALQAQNDVILVLASKLELSDIPDWKTKDEVEEKVGPKINACMEAVRKVYGHSEADKS